ncbi:25176_t:CDS:1, partial [Racocetra persica]
LCTAAAAVEPQHETHSLILPTAAMPKYQNTSKISKYMVLALIVVTESRR